MKKFSFSLQKVLHLKEMQLENEMHVLSNLQHRHRLLTEELNQLTQHYQTTRQRHLASSAAGMPVHQLRSEQYYLKSLQQDIRQKNMQIERCLQEIASQVKKLVALRAEKISLEKLREKKFQEYQKKEQKANELFIEEFVANVQRR